MAPDLTPGPLSREERGSHAPMAVPLGRYLEPAKAGFAAERSEAIQTRV
jgi:hypothetical protein